MPRKRTISPEFFTDEDIGDLHPLERLLFIGMWCHADKAGRMKDKPRTIKSCCLPYDDLDIDAALTKLAGCGFIIRYEAGGESVIQIRTWDLHQNPHHTETDSKLPIFTPLNNGANTVKQPLSNGVHTSHVPCPMSHVPEPKNQERTVHTLEGIDLPAVIDTPEVRQALTDWVVYKKGYKRAGMTALVKKAAGMETPERVIAAVEHSLAGKYAGLFEPGTNGSKQPSAKVDPLAKYLKGAQRANP